MRHAMHFQLLAIGLLLIPWLAAPAADKPPAGSYTNAECVGCHDRRDSPLVQGWRASRHAHKSPKADCVTCHGGTHTQALAQARRDAVCVGCHEKLGRAVVHSYATSKHGVIVKLEQDRWDWSKPLARGNYRAPDCAYCHMHNGGHNVSAAVLPWNPLVAPEATRAQEVRTATQQVCGDCHAPRYVAEQLATGERMTEIARMKLREAREVIDRQQGTTTQEQMTTLEQRFGTMGQHGRHVRLGVGHQSPDYQWWHGQPALDGDLLRIKGLVSEIGRRRILPPEQPGG